MAYEEVGLGVAIGTWIGDKLLAPAVVAVLFTGLTNVLLERHKATRDLATKIADTLRDDLRALQALAIEYWGRQRNGGDEVFEARMIAAQEEVLRTIALLADEFELDICSGRDPRPEFLDALSGGAFGSRDRAADPDRVVRISKAIGDMRSRVIQRRATRLRKRGV